MMQLLEGHRAIVAGGASGSLSRLHDYPLEEWDRLVRVNLGGVFHCMRGV